jgi:hypothetical protein
MLVLAAPEGTGVGAGVGVVAGAFVGLGAAVGVALMGAGVAGCEFEPDSEGRAPPEAEPPPPPQAASIGRTTKSRSREDLKHFITPFVVGLNMGSLKLLAWYRKGPARLSGALRLRARG